MFDAFATFDTGNTVGGAAASGILTGAQFGAGAAGTYTSSKSYDTGAAGVPAAIGPSYLGAGGGTIGGPLIHDLGRGIRLKFDVRITAAVTSAGAATVQVNFLNSVNADLSAGVALLSSEVVPKATLVVGYRYRHGHTPGVVPSRYVGAQVVIGTAALTAGTYSAGLTLDEEDHADVLG